MHSKNRRDSKSRETKKDTKNNNTKSTSTSWNTIISSEVIDVVNEQSPIISVFQIIKISLFSGNVQERVNNLQEVVLLVGLTGGLRWLH